MQDQRKQARSPAFLGAQMSYKQKLWRAECIVKNTSAGGAKLLSTSASIIPDRFDLRVPQQNAKYEVATKWQRGKELGVAIERTVPLTDPAEDTLRLKRRANRLERENAAMRRRLALAAYTD